MLTLLFIPRYVSHLCNLLYHAIETTTTTTKKLTD